MKKRLPTLILIAVFLAGMSLLLYPVVSNYFNSFHQTKAITSYEASVASLTLQDDVDYLQAAEDYNAALLAKGQVNYNLTDEEKKEYTNTLNIDGNGMMGYLSIQKLKVQLPVYHGTDESVLAAGIGHLEGSALPVGGVGTHCVLSGHRGLPSAKLLTDLDQMEVGDVFTLTILKEVLTYEVDQIRIVEPDDSSNLGIDPQQDYCTLVTCTPYGINSHRLLVRGHRVETVNQTYVAADATQIDPLLVAPVVAAPVLVILLIWLLVGTRKPKKGGDQAR